MQGIGTWSRFSRRHLQDLQRLIWELQQWFPILQYRCLTGPPGSALGAQTLKLSNGLDLLTFCRSILRHSFKP